MSTKPINVEAIEKQTKISWGDWLKYFDKIGAKDLSHGEIAKKVYAKGVPGWWSQSITVAYEQHIGRRVPGQDCEGSFQVGISKTINGTMDEALEKWIHKTDGLEEFSSIPITKGPETSATKKWRYWRCGLSDGSRVNLNIYQKTPTKAILGIAHEKLESVDQIEHWREYWKEFVINI